MITITLTTTTQAEFANRLHRAARDLSRVLREVEKAAAQDREFLAAGLRPSGLGHQSLSEVVKYQGQFEVLSEMAVLQGLTDEQIHTLITEPRVWATTAE
jgi:hypothetical protein